MFLCHLMLGGGGHASVICAGSISAHEGLGVYAVLMCEAGNPLISVQDVKHFRADLVLVIALCNQGC